MQIHIDAFGEKAGARVLLCDDLIATGGTAKASVELINKTNANCVEACFLIDLVDLKGSQNLRSLTNVYSILEV